MPARPRLPRALLFVTAAAAACAVAAGCAAAPAPPAAAGAPAAPAPPAPTPALTVTDPWVKASGTATTGTGAMSAPVDGARPSGSAPPSAPTSMAMTAVFGTLTANGPAPVTVVSASTSASPRTELHEVVGDGDQATMRVKEGGFEVAPGAPHLLAPGDDHIMIMDLTSPIRAGDQVEVTLTLSDGSTTTFTALAKETTGGEESYESDADGGTAPAGHGG